MAQLRRRKPEFDALHVQIAVIGFVRDERVTIWLEQTKSPFPLMLDPDRRVYDAYGMGRSFVRVWSLKVMWHYFKLMLRGERLRGIQGDPHQLGGDVLVDRGGTVRLAYRSQDPTDRPGVDELLAAARELVEAPPDHERHADG